MILACSGLTVFGLVERKAVILIVDCAGVSGPGLLPGGDRSTSSATSYSDCHGTHDL